MTGLCPRCKRGPATHRVLIYSEQELRTAALPIGQESYAVCADCVQRTREYLTLYDAQVPGVVPAGSDPSKGIVGVDA